jgi:hypothetical protein
VAKLIQQKGEFGTITKPNDRKTEERKESGEMKAGAALAPRWSSNLLS